MPTYCNSPLISAQNTAPTAIIVHTLSAVQQVSRSLRYLELLLLYHLSLSDPAHPVFLHNLSQNYEAEISAVLFWSYLASVFTLPPYLSLFMWIVGMETGAETVSIS